MSRRPTYRQKKAANFNFFQSIMNGDIKAVRSLLNQGFVDINKANNLDWTPLQAAVVHGHAKIVELLLNSGADVNLRNTSEKTDFRRDMCLTAYYEESFRPEVKNGVVTSMTPLHLGVVKKNRDVVEVLLRANPDTSARDADGRTAFDYVLAKSDIEMIEAFVESGIKIRNEYSWKQKVLLEGIVKCDRAIVECLLRLGVDLNVEDGSGNLPLHVAVAKGEFDMIEYLVSRGADLCKANSWGQTPVHVAVVKGNFMMLKYLLSRGANVNVRDNNGQTPLHYALTRLVTLSLEIVKFLIKNSVNAYVLDNERRTPLMHFLSKKQENLNLVDQKKTFLRILLESSDANVVDFEHRNVLTISNNPQLVEVVIQHLAKMQALNLPILPDILNVILNWTEFKNYFSRCKKELIQAKTTKLRNSWVTYFNLLMDSKKSLRNYAGNRDLVDDFKNTKVLQKFPIYGVYMKKNMRQGMKKRELFDKSTYLFSRVCPIFSPSHLIVLGVLDCLGKKDLLRLFE